MDSASLLIPDNVEFSKLKGEASTGKVKIWSVNVENRNDGFGWIVIRHGYESGKIQVIEKCIKDGKNKGKINETSPFQQAIIEARSSWQKKKDSGYIEISGSSSKIPETVMSSRSIISVQESPLPMLALDFNKRGHSIIFPCYVQRKYDGTRCVAIPGRGLFSRNRKPYPNLGHIQSEIDLLGKDGNLIFDGELYSDELTFQEIVSLVRSQKLKEDQKVIIPKIKFHCYDIIDTDGKIPFISRKVLLDSLFRKLGPFDSLRLVESEVCSTKDELKMFHDKYVSEGFEGIMLRNNKGTYATGQRSANLQKYKEFEDAEYCVQDFTEGEGLEKGCVIWLCRDEPTNKIFACRPRGSHEERRNLFNIAKNYIGKMLTVRYQELTDDGLPRFPVGIEFRDYE